MKLVLLNQICFLAAISAVFGARSLYKNLEGNYGDIILDSDTMKDKNIENGNSYFHRAKAWMPDFKFFGKSDALINVSKLLNYFRSIISISQL